MQSLDLQFHQLAELAARLDLTESEFQSLLYRLSAQQRRLFLLLAEAGEADTAALRAQCGVTNPSHIATALNTKLAHAGDPRRVRCVKQLHTDAYGTRGVLGRWSLVAHEASAGEATR